MRVQPRAVSRFLEAPDAECRVMLIYGGDDSLVRERAETILKARGVQIGDAFQHDDLTNDLVNAEPERFFEAALARSLMGGPRGLRVTGASDKIAKHVESYLSAPNPECTIVLCAGALARNRSSLVKLCEKDPAAAAIACYEDSASDREGVILSELKERDVTIEAEALDWAAEALSVDRGVARSEARKLALYATPGARLSLDDTRAALDAQGAVGLDDLAFDAASGLVGAADLDLDRAAREDISGVAIIRVLIGHFSRLLSLRRRVDAGEPLEDVIKRARPPIFFKRTDAMRRQIRLWRASMIETQLLEFARVESALKTTGASETALIQRAVLQTAVIAQRAQRTAR